MSVTAASLGSASSRLVHGPNSPLRDIARLCARIASSEATVLLTGETGTGKEVFARLIHENSPRAGRALVPVNCAAIPEALLESELFGYVRGAFTGAVQSRRGRLALAEKGTLFLDEIGELPLSLQAKLLRVLQERSYEPVGSTEPVPADFRLVAATNRDLAADVEEGRFRRDLYYRLHVCPVELPPLRERPADVAPLFLHFWNRRGEKREIAPAALAALAGHDWPGNVRELENLVERVSICSESEVIGLEDLPEEIRRAPLVLDAFRKQAQVQGEKASEAAALQVATPNTARSGVVEPPPTPWPPAQEKALGEDHVAAGSEEAGDATVAEADATQAAPLASEAPATESNETPSVEEESPLVAPEEAATLLPLDLPGLLRQIEERYIDAALERSAGNKKAAAELLGLQRTTLVEKLKRKNRDAARPG